jgi:hypothetical protein
MTMTGSESFSDSIYEDQTHLAERELSAFTEAVTELFGPEQARASTEDWLEESELMDSPPLSTERDWRSVSIAASARLASRVDAAAHRQKSLTALADGKVQIIPSSNCFAATLPF